jgi:hypothetical protein
MSLYVTVMGVALIVSAIGLSAIVVARTQLRLQLAEQDAGRARLVASSAVENALVAIRTNPNWRTDYVNDVEYPASPASLVDGEFTWKAVDSDGSLSDDDADAVRLYGIGRVGQQICTESVLVQPSAPLGCLEVSLCAQGNITFESATVTGNQFISSNGAASATGSNINPTVEAVNAVSGETYNGGTTPGITARTMPDPATVFDFYVANGTPIDYATLDSAPGGARAITKQLLSPTVNPYGLGETNPEGIYVIDCQAGRIRISACRIVGTLVLLNVGANSEFFIDLNIAPAVPNYPSLMIQGDIEFFHDAATVLSEDVAGISYNPPGTPYEGQEDTDIADTYPTVIKGLVYVSGNVISFDNPAFDGVLVVGNTMTIQQLLDVNYQSTYLTNPPPGFRTGGVMQIVRGSWRRGPGS